jgi:hypothetical protein
MPVRHVSQPSAAGARAARVDLRFWSVWVRFLGLLLGCSTRPISVRAGLPTWLPLHIDEAGIRLGEELPPLSGRHLLAGLGEPLS